MLSTPERVEQIRAGEKTITRRDWKRRQVTAGGVYIASTETFASHGDADCYIPATDVYDESLGATAPAQADREDGGHRRRARLRRSSAL